MSEQGYTARERLDKTTEYLCDLCPHVSQDLEGARAHKAVHVAGPELLTALKAFLRAPSVGSSGHGSVTIEVQEFNLKAARSAVDKAEPKGAATE